MIFRKKKTGKGRRSEAMDELTRIGKHSETFPEYGEGFDSFRAGNDSCPYPMQGGYNLKRLLWWKGYLAARTAHLL